VQDVTGLSSGQLKLTVSKFYRVSGDSTQHRGVVPDIEFPSLYDKDEVGESQQDNALPWDNIHSVPFKPLPGVKQFVPRLAAEHELRIASDPDFVHLVDSLELSNSWDADKAVSLNIETRRARSGDWDTQRFLLENKRRKLKGLELYADQQAWKSDNKNTDDDEALADTDTEVEIEGTVEGGSSEEQPEAAAIGSSLTSSPASAGDSIVDNAETAKKKGEDEEEDDIAESDPMLQEAGHILADQIRLLAKPIDKQMMVQTQKDDK
jgi:carboxyl-terminal processing protease